MLGQIVGGSWRRSARRLGSEHDVVAERVEAADEALGRAVLVQAVEVIGPELGEGRGPLQHVEYRDQDLVAIATAAFFADRRAFSR